MSCTRCNQPITTHWQFCPPGGVPLEFCSITHLFESLRETYGDVMQKEKFDRFNARRTPGLAPSFKRDPRFDETS